MKHAAEMNGYRRSIPKKEKRTTHFRHSHIKQMLFSCVPEQCAADFDKNAFAICPKNEQRFVQIAKKWLMTCVFAENMLY